MYKPLLLPLFAALSVTAGDAQQQTQSFSYTGAVQTFQVPAGVTALTIQASGAQGGAGSPGTPGGKGATLSATFPVTPLETLSILVGGAGGTFTHFGESNGGGGGASFVYRPGFSLLLAAAGGGGGVDDQVGVAGSATTAASAGQSPTGAPAGANGNGGGRSLILSGGGSGGGLRTDGGFNFTGQGGKALVNGAAGGTWSGGGSGGFGGGGAGAVQGGGGGGGYNGGGGGSAGVTQIFPGAGGGGGSFTDATATAGPLVGAPEAGDGQVVLTWIACQPPTVTSLTASPNTLWPPNGAMTPVALTVTDTGGCGSVTCKIISVKSSEPIDAGGDWEITGNLTLNLRAARLGTRVGTGNGRVYTITVQCTDSNGNAVTKTVTVLVPHFQGHNGG